MLVIIPAYNEATNLKRVVEDLSFHASFCDYLIINDGSTDNTVTLCEENHYHHLDLIANLGLFGAVQTGLKYAYLHNYDIAIQFDGDGQHMASYIKDLVKVIENGTDIAIGSRFVTEKKPFSFRMIGSTLISFFILLVTFKRIKDPTSGMRAYNRDTISDYAFDMNNPPEPDTLVYMIKKKRKVKEIQVSMRERVSGQTIFNIGSSIRYMGRVLISILFIQPFRKMK